MKAKQILLILILLSIGLCFPISAQRTEPANVRDYFLLVPQRYIGYDRNLREQLLTGNLLGTVIDVKNGFISYKASDNPEEFEFAIFRKADGKYLVAFSVPYDPYYPEGDSALLFLTYDNGRWADVTKAMLPRPFNKRLTYRLPRQGTKIRVKDQAGRTQYTLVWTRSKFLVSDE